MCTLPNPFLFGLYLRLPYDKVLEVALAVEGAVALHIVVEILVALNFGLVLALQIIHGHPWLLPGLIKSSL